ncbi:MAG: hypothetical protein ABSA54_01245 [Terriglobales bacterium]
MFTRIVGGLVSVRSQGSRSSFNPCQPRARGGVNALAATGMDNSVATRTGLLNVA